MSQRQIAEALGIIIHQYDQIDRDLTWLTLSRDLPSWRTSLEALFSQAAATIEEAAD